MSASYADRLAAAVKSQGSLLCVGLDPDPALMPKSLAANLDFFSFCREIIDAVADSAVAFKPQIAFFAAYAKEDELERLIRHIKDQHPTKLVLLDAKRSDIGNTARLYAREAFERYGADAVTVNPMMGWDSIAPFHEGRADRGCYLLCHTSNPGSADFQRLALKDGGTLARKVAEGATKHRGTARNLGLVIGATYPQEITELLQGLPSDLPLLIPGIGAQGGDLEATLQALHSGGRDSHALINISRAVLYADSSEQSFAAAAGEAAKAWKDRMWTRNC